jgi:hypothetical protein
MRFGGCRPDNTLIRAIAAFRINGWIGAFYGGDMADHRQLHRRRRVPGVLAAMNV